MCTKGHAILLTLAVFKLPNSQNIACISVVVFFGVKHSANENDCICTAIVCFYASADRNLTAEIRLCADKFHRE